MKESPLKCILDREAYEDFVSRGFTPSLALLEEVIDYGTNLLPRAFDSSDRKIPDVVIVMNFLKHGVTMLDAVHILLRKSAVVSAHLPLRALLEIQIYLKWILSENAERRATMYFVWEMRQKRLWALRCKIGSDEWVEHSAQMADGPGTEKSPLVDQAFIERQLVLIDRKLNSPECISINAEFESIAVHLKREPAHWYAPDKMRSLYHIAAAVQMKSLYRTFYGSFSRFHHAQTVDAHVLIKNGTAFYEPIRSPIDLDQVLRNALSIAFSIYRLILKRYRPGEVDSSFRTKYVAEWRERFTQIPSLINDGSTYTIVPPGP